jgi:hypothetical protein
MRKLTDAFTRLSRGEAATTAALDLADEPPPMNEEETPNPPKVITVRLQK